MSRELEFPDLEQDPTEDLAFQDIRHTSPSGAHSPSRKSEARTGLLASEKKSGNSADDEVPGEARGGYFSLSYYQQWFDIESETLLKRVGKSMMPPLTTFYQEDEHADLYGPFWITTTLIVAIASASNLANFISSSDSQGWKSDFTKVSFAASLLYSWLAILPLVVYFFLKRLGCEKPLASIISFYGYSFTVFIPTALLCVIPSSFVRWVLVFASLGLSTSFLVRNIWTTLPSEKQVQGYLLLAIIGVSHAALAFTFKLYFFYY